MARSNLLCQLPKSRAPRCLDTGARANIHRSISEPHLRLTGTPNWTQADLQNLPPFITPTSTSGSGIPFKLIASRVAHKPMLEAETPDGPIQLPLDVSKDTLPVESDAFFAKLGGNPKGAKDVVQGLWKTWRDNDLLRITGKLDVGSGKLNDLHVVADDFGLYRSNLKELADAAKVHPLETQAEAGRLFYHKSREGGNIACYGYGAGIAMSTMDALLGAGGKAANFLDGGGGATEANVRAAMGVITSDPDADVIFINSFGGLTKMDLIAEGMVKFLRERRDAGERLVPIVARLRGTGEESAAQILKDATDLSGIITVIPDLKEAAEAAVRIAAQEAEKNGTELPKPSAAEQAPVAVRDTPVTFSRDGQYEQTLGNLKVKNGDPVLMLGLGGAAKLNAKIASDYGTNIVGFAAPNKGGQEFIGKPVYGSMGEAIKELKPRIASLFVPVHAAADAMIDAIEAEIPLIVAYAEGIPTRDQLRVQAALRSQNKSRVVGANCPGVIFPHERVKLGIQPLPVHSPGDIGIVSRSGTISYDLAAQTSALGLGQSAVYGLGGDPFPCTRTWEAVQLMIEDPKTKVICIVGECGGQMEEEAAQVYAEYVRNLPAGQVPKPAVGFVAGEATKRGLMYGHAGAVWWEPEERTLAKKKFMQNAGITMADTLGDLGALIKQTHAKL